MDFSQLAPAAQQELGTFLDDEFCYCGCPHTLSNCVRSHSSCRHGKRMASLAAAEAAMGASASEMSMSLAAYYPSFRAARQPLKADPRLCRGPADAPLTVVEFFDFECPACNTVRPALDALAKRKDVRLCAVPFPLPGHPNAMPAGQAALLARDRGRYWELHALLFENQRRLSVPVIVELAEKAGLKGAEVRAAIDSGRYLDELGGFKELGHKSGVTGTPHVFVNGRSLVLPVAAEFLNHAADDELEWAGDGPGWAHD